MYSVMLGVTADYFAAAWDVYMEKCLIKADYEGSEESVVVLLWEQWDCRACVFIALIVS